MVALEYLDALEMLSSALTWLRRSLQGCGPRDVAGAVIPNRTPRIVAAFRGGVGATLQGQQLGLYLEPSRLGPAGVTP